MSWSEIAPMASGLAGKAPVSLSASAGRGRRRTITLVVRPGLLDGLDWWTPGARAGVQLGHGEHEGQMRVTPGGPHRLRRRRVHAVEWVSLCFEAFTWTAPGAQKGQAVEFDHNDGWIEVTLPAWARRPAGLTGQRPPTPMPAVSSPQPRAPFRSALDGVPDPAAAGRPFR